MRCLSNDDIQTAAVILASARFDALGRAEILERRIPPGCDFASHVRHFRGKNLDIPAGDSLPALAGASAVSICNDCYRNDALLTF